MARGDRGDRFTEMEGLYAGFTVYDMHYEKIGEVDDLFVDEDDQPEYVGVKMGFLGLRSTLIPWGMVRVNEKREMIEVSDSKDRVKDAPTFDSDEEITPEFEEQVYRHFGLQREEGPQRSAYGSYYRDDDAPPPPDTADEPRPETDRPETDRPETDRRESRIPNVRKRARAGSGSGPSSGRPGVSEERGEGGTERGEGGRGASSGTGEGEGIVVPVTEERIVIRKRPVVKEEIRISKRVVEDEEVIEVPVRKEEAEIIDETGSRDA